MPVNPEDEDDVVPDMHAAFGINRALGQGQEGGGGQTREPAWRDFGLEELVRRGPRVERGWLVVLLLLLLGLGVVWEG